MFPDINAIEIQDPIVCPEETESSLFYVPSVKQSQIASVNLNGFGSVMEESLPIGSVIPAVEALHWSVGQNCDVRPRLLDKSTGTHRLLDTGSQISTTNSYFQYIYVKTDSK